MKRTKRTKRKRSKPAKVKKNLICDNVREENKCWYVGNCPHREPHAPIIIDERNMCEAGFCSLMRITTGCHKIHDQH